MYNPFDLPNLSKGSVGFDTILKRLETMTEAFPKIPTYPPYNIKKTGDNTYVIEIAVAGAYVLHRLGIYFLFLVDDDVFDAAVVLVIFAC